MGRDRERSSGPVETFVSKNSNNIKVNVWSKGGKTLQLSVPPKKDDPDSDWMNQTISFYYKNQAEDMIDALEQCLDNWEEEEERPRREERKSSGSKYRR